MDKINTSIPIQVVFHGNDSVSFVHDGNKIPARQALSLLATGKGHILYENKPIEYSLHSGQKFYRNAERFLIQFDI